MSDATPRNGYITVPMLVSALLGVTLALAGVGSAYLGAKLETRDSRIEALERWKDKADDRIVPWATHQEKWNAQKALDDRLAQRIDDLGKKMDAEFPASDTIADLRARLQKLETERPPRQ